MSILIPKPGGYLPIDIVDVLERCKDYFDNRADVVDGDYGVPFPNEEMSLFGDVCDALEALEVFTHKVKDAMP